MALSDEVTTRIPNQTLINLTRPNSRGNNSVDTTILGKASDDVEAAFKTYIQIVFDITDAQHIDVAVDGVVAKLKQRNTGEGKGWKDWIEIQAKALKGVTARDRIDPLSTSELTPAREKTGKTDVRPHFDPHANFGGYKANDPRIGGQDSDN